MMNAKKSLLPTGLLIVVLLAATSSSLAQITPRADAYTNSASAGTNFGKGNTCIRSCSEWRPTSSAFRA